MPAERAENSSARQDLSILQREDRANGIIVSSDGVTGTLVDQWGNPFRIVADGDGDNHLANPDTSSETKILRQTIIVYSAGPDGNFAT